MSADTEAPSEHSLTSKPEVALTRPEPSQQQRSAGQPPMSSSWLGRLGQSRRQNKANKKANKKAKKSRQPQQNLQIMRTIIMTLFVASVIFGVLLNSVVLIVVFALLPSIAMFVLDRTEKKLVAFSVSVLNLAGLLIAWLYMDRLGLNLFSSSVTEAPLFSWFFPIVVAISALGIHYVVPTAAIRFRMANLDMQLESLEKDLEKLRSKWGERLPSYTTSGMEILQEGDVASELAQTVTAEGVPALAQDSERPKLGFEDRNEAPEVGRAQGSPEVAAAHSGEDSAATLEIAQTGPSQTDPSQAGSPEDSSEEPPKNIRELVERTVDNNPAGAQQRLSGLINEAD